MVELSKDDIVYVRGGEEHYVAASKFHKKHKSTNIHVTKNDAKYHAMVHRIISGRGYKFKRKTKYSEYLENRIQNEAPELLIGQ